ncbi:expressed unknown protein [Seminavis robusta]|uniref:VWFD domain-containing protein n=1 Tax=Seminavis robusta TaxID=568900 RepID=A0A9N8DIX3_9STRA|nr:expressed unknown protein [Seminavis robusta]|eukprot:Sro112_g055791.1  (312) ;mRNA; f:85302-86346
MMNLQYAFLFVMAFLPSVLAKSGGGVPAPTTSGGTAPTPVNSGVAGDPHIKSWAGEWFDYHGACDLKLIHVPRFQGKADLDIHVRATQRYEYSFIETAAVRLGNDTLEVSAWGEYAFNGVDGALINTGTEAEETNLRGKNPVIISTIGGYPIIHTPRPAGKNTHRFDIILSDDSKIAMSILKDIVSVKVRNATLEDFGKVVGLLGDFHGSMLARDGVTDLSEHMNAMGQEWQVRDDEPMLFQAARAPQYPAKCILPDLTKAKEARRLGEGITEESAKLACAHLKEDPGAFRNCVYDVTATNDLDMATSGAF